MRDLKVIFSTFKLQMSQSFSRPTFRFCIIVQPLIYTFILYFMYKDSQHINFTNYVILGSGISSLWSSICFSSAGDIERERFMGTLENLFACPAKFTSIVLGKILANTFLGLSGLILSILFVKLFFNASFYINNIPLFLLSFILTLIAFISIALLISPIFTLSRNARALMNCLEYPVFILCGFLFPIDILPTFTRPLSYILSPTLSVELLREASDGITNYKLFFTKILFLIALCLIYIIISKILFKKIDKRTRVTASLGVN